MRNQFTEEQETWLQDLESGDFKQTTENLKDKYGYCCLGVAAERYAPHLVEYGTGRSSKGNDYGDQLCDDGLVDKLQLYGETGNFQEVQYIGDHKFGALTEMNDNGRTFQQIAEFIREYPWQVFTNFDEPETEAND